MGETPRHNTRVPSEQDQEIRDFAGRVADYIETADRYPNWSKRECAIEAVRIALQEARYETQAIIEATS